jgi:hypothetical protein
MVKCTKSSTRYHLPVHGKGYAEGGSVVRGGSVDIPGGGGVAGGGVVSADLDKWKLRFGLEGENYSYPTGPNSRNSVKNLNVTNAGVTRALPNDWSVSADYGSTRGERYPGDYSSPRRNESYKLQLKKRF